MIRSDSVQEKHFNLIPGFILNFIKESTTMNEEEYRNWREIRRFLKSDPDFINKYLKALNLGAVAKINRGVKNIMTKSNNQKLEKIMSLLTTGGQKVVNLIADGVPRTELANRLGILEPSLYFRLAEIYKKTSPIIKYGKYNRFADLHAYISDALSASDKDNRSENVENRKQNKIGPAEAVSVVEDKDKNAACKLPVQHAPIEWHSHSEILQLAADLLTGEYTKMCTTLGQFAVDGAFNACTAVNNAANLTLVKARKFQTAIDVINDVAKELTQEGV